MMPRTLEGGATQRVVDALSKGIDDINASRILRGTLVEDVNLSMSSTDVSHGLGFDPLYIVVKRSANAVVYDYQGTNPFPTRTLRLAASGNVTVTLYVF